MRKIANPSLTYGYNNNTTLNQNLNSSHNNSTIFYNLVGNFIPPEWSNLTASDGKTLSKTAKQLLSLIVSCLNSDDSSDSDELQEGYYFFEAQLGLCQRRVRQCLLELEQGDFINVNLRSMVKNYNRCRNILHIRLVKKFQVCSQKFSGEPENYFASTRNNFHPLHYIDNNISILESRYSESGFVDKFEEENQRELIQNSQAEEIIAQKCNCSAVVTAQDTTKPLQPDNTKHPASKTQPTSSPSWIGSIASKAAKFCQGKSLSDFHPLSEEDGSTLRIRSNRDFNLSYINKLLLKLSKSYPNHRFYSKKALLNYMSKALTYELRQTTKVNNVNFNFKSDDEVRTKEQYLQKIEYSSSIDEYSQLRRKIAAVFDRDTAYKLLTGCRFVGVVRETDDTYNISDTNHHYRLTLLQDFTLSDIQKSVILNQVRAVYGSQIQELRLVPYEAKLKLPNQTTKEHNLSQAPYPSLAHLNHDSIWYKVRKYLIDHYGSAIDKSWFSKLELIEEDGCKRKVLLKPSTAFIGDWIKNNYMRDIIKAFERLDFSCELVPVVDRRLYA